jgi:hypothetical protein
VASAVFGFTGRENTAKNRKENAVKKISKRYRLGTLVAVIFLPVCALLAPGMPGASAASTSAQLTSSPMTTVKFADSAVAASAATRSTPAPSRRRDAPACVAVVTKAEYPITWRVNAGCLAGAVSYPGNPHVGEAIALAACSGFLLWAKIDYVTTSAACAAANPFALVITGTQWCGPDPGHDCLNAWGGGPYVNVYTGGPETRDTDQHFLVIAENGDQNTAEIMFTGSSAWGGRCIGDASNDSTLADVSLDACALPGQSAGWGTQMTWGTSGCPSGEAWFKDNHWPGYLGPSGGAVNGSHWYLNKPSKVCLAFIIDG